MDVLILTQIALLLFVGGVIGAALAYRRNRRQNIGLGMAIIMRGYVRAAENLEMGEELKALTNELDDLVNDTYEFSYLFDFARQAIWKMRQ